MRVAEIFKGIQGEGVHMNIPMSFIRLYGCNKRCTYCDTLYAVEGGKYENLSVGQIIERIKPHDVDWVAITGGEPLIHRDLIDLIAAVELKTEIWTNGTIRPPSWMYSVNSWVVDVKCPSSSVDGLDIALRWYDRMRLNDQLKFTVSDERDLEFVDSFLSGTPMVGLTVVVSPVIPRGFNADHGGDSVCMSMKWPRRVWQYCVDKDYRFSLQQHKIVWGEKVGV